MFKACLPFLKNYCLGFGYNAEKHENTLELSKIKSLNNLMVC